MAQHHEGQNCGVHAAALERGRASGLAVQLDEARAELRLALEDLCDLARGTHEVDSMPGSGTLLRARLPCG